MVADNTLDVIEAAPQFIYWIKRGIEEGYSTEAIKNRLIKGLNAQGLKWREEEKASQGFLPTYSVVCMNKSYKCGELAALLTTSGLDAYIERISADES